MSETPDRVVCVIVTHNRPDQLAQSLRAVSSQSRPPDHVVLVDNSPLAANEQSLIATGLTHTYLPSGTNMGGAGGFAYGILPARAVGADWVWLADDDGMPGGPDTLEILLRGARAQAWDAISPVVVDTADPQRLAFPMRRGRTWARTLADLGDVEFINGIAQLFNGALFKAEVFDTIGVPDPRLFVRGDEVEMHRRLVRSRTAFGTCTAATYRHPTGASDFVPILGGRAVVYLPEPGPRADIALRNQGYLTSLPGMRWRRWPDEVRYGWYYLTRGDLAGWRAWRERRAEGRREQFPARD